LNTELLIRTIQRGKFASASAFSARSRFLPEDASRSAHHPLFAKQPAYGNHTLTSAECVLQPEPVQSISPLLSYVFE
jgi:hypothetical protein